MTTNSPYWFAQYQHWHSFRRRMSQMHFLPLKLISEKHIPTSTASIMCWDYFEDNYIGRTRRGRPHAQPKFPIALWNVESRTEEDLPLPRINNNVEGWHNRFYRIINLTVLIQHCEISWKTLRLRKVWAAPKLLRFLAVASFLPRKSMLTVPNELKNS